eukprot:g2914.t1
MATPYIQNKFGASVHGRKDARDLRAAARQYGSERYINGISAFRSETGPFALKRRRRKGRKKKRERRNNRLPQLERNTQKLRRNLRRYDSSIRRRKFVHTWGGGGGDKSMEKLLEVQRMKMKQLEEALRIKERESAELASKLMVTKAERVRIAARAEEERNRTLQAQKKRTEMALTRKRLQLQLRKKENSTKALEAEVARAKLDALRRSQKRVHTSPLRAPTNENRVKLLQQRVKRLQKAEMRIKRREELRTGPRRKKLGFPTEETDCRALQTAAIEERVQRGKTLLEKIRRRSITAETFFMNGGLKKETICFPEFLLALQRSRINMKEENARIIFELLDSSGEKRLRLVDLKRGFRSKTAKMKEVKIDQSRIQDNEKPESSINEKEKKEKETENANNEAVPQYDFEDDSDFEKDSDSDFESDSDSS